MVSAIAGGAGAGGKYGAAPRNKLRRRPTSERTIVRALVGLRRNLFRGAAPYLPPAPAMAETMEAGAA